jgi:hypothetical protein
LVTWKSPDTSSPGVETSISKGLLEGQTSALIHNAFVTRDDVETAAGSAKLLDTAGVGAKTAENFASVSTSAVSTEPGSSYYYTTGDYSYSKDASSSSGKGGNRKTQKPSAKQNSTAEKHSFSDMGVDKTGYIFFSEYIACDSMLYFNVVPSWSMIDAWEFISF